MEPAPATPAARPAPEGVEGHDGDERDGTQEALAALVARLDLACEELFAVTPYAGDQSTGSALDGCVDEIVAALRTLRADADDLRRVMAVARLRRGDGR
jgi:hypothetical protein